MFTHPTDDYDVLLKLDPKVLTRYHQNVLMDETQLVSSRRIDDDKDEAGPGFDPALALFKDLRVSLGSLASFYQPAHASPFPFIAVAYLPRHFPHIL